MPDAKTEPAVVPYYVFESQMARMEIHNRRATWLTVAAWVVAVGAVVFAVLK